MKGTRNDTLYREALKLGQFIGAGGLSRGTAETALLKAAVEVGLSWEAGRGTIASGIGKGIQSPKPLRGRAVTTIVISTDMSQVIDDAEEVLILEKVGVFRRGGSLVQIVRDSGRLVPGLARPLGAPIIAAVSETHMRERIADSARWLGKNRQGDLVPALPPPWAARGLLDRCEGRLRHLEGITETPFLCPDYKIKSDQGYDPSSGILLESNLLESISVPDRPTRASARMALEKLLDPFQDFPFVSPSDRLVPLAAILSLLARPAISGPCPMFAFRATAPGTGKSLLADLVSLIATGRPAARMSASRDDDELRKRILAIGLEGSPVVLIDNVEGSLRSQSLGAALTSDTWSDRILGASKTATVPLRAVWLCTGNNLMFEGDLGRRVIPCDLDAGCEHPEDRTDFKFPDVKSYVQKKRSALVGAALTILRAYAIAEFPSHGKPPKGSFEAWDQLVRGALTWSAGLDLLDGCARIRSDSDRDLEGLRQLIRSWREAIGDRPMTAAEIIGKCWKIENLKFALETMVACDASSLSSLRLGKALQKFNGRVVEGHRIRRVKHNRAGAIVWGVEAVKKQDGV